MSLLFCNVGLANQLLKCVDINDGTTNNIYFNPNKQTWSNESQKNMTAKLIDGNLYAVFEFSEGSKYTTSNIKFNIQTKKLFLDFYDMDRKELLSELLNATTKYMNKNQIFDVKDISDQEGIYTLYQTINDKFRASKKTISNCSSEIKTNTSNNIYDLPEILKNSDDVQNAQLAEYLLEATHILSKAKIHLKKCLDEYNLYNSLKEKFCSSLYEKMKILYVPAEKAMSQVRPKIQSAYEKYGSNPEDAPTWYIDLNRELGPIGTAISEYRKYRDEVEALFASN